MGGPQAPANGERLQEDDQMTNKRKIHSPLYLVTAYWPCWQCETKIPLAALLAAKVDENSGEACMLSNITQLPDEVLAFIQQRVPSFKYAYSKTMASKYFANTCPGCGEIQGDYYLHSESGSPFFPFDKKAARLLYMSIIPLAEPVVIDATYRTGSSCDIILANAKREDEDA